MRWSSPKMHDERIVTKFLFLPKCINNDCRWLEKVIIKQTYSSNPFVSGWFDLAFISNVKH